MTRRLGVRGVGIFVALAIAVGALAGCGGGSSSTSAPATETSATAPRPVTAADVREAKEKSQRLRRLYEESWREYQHGR
jgi:ABC-type Fe3+-hydroxamate transport system substrate-binding protein